MVFIFLILLVISILLLRLKIQIKNLELNTDKKDLFNNDYVVSFTIFLLGFMPVFKIKITKDKLKKVNIKRKLKEQMRNTNIKTQLNKRNLEMLKILIPEVKQLELKIKFGIEDAAITAIVYSSLKTILVNILKKDIEVEAIFNNKNQLNMHIEGIFELKLIHIINKLIIYNKDRRVYKNERTSNRRAYAYSNE